jgi:hypothetical protein
MKRYAQVTMLLLLILLLALATAALAQSSTHYQLPWHVWGAGGGSSSSTSYHLDSTRGQAFAGYAASANYQMGVGYWYGAGGGHRVLLPAVMNSYAAPTELAFDDGTMDTTASWETGKGFAVCFSPPGGSAKLQAARYYVQDPVAIEVHVWDVDGHELITAFQTTLAQDGWNDVDLSSYDLTVTGDFCVGFLHAEDYRPTLGVDTSGGGHSFEVDGAYWELQSSDYMIRAVVVP